ncbi:MAG TPA: amidohydrolase, partial [Alphaproteobacteria bacterium]|nr:amidohydrolase [Alphaproteobacteria bacterium]
CTHPDAEYKDACFKAYNRWLQEFCGGAPNRLFGLAQTAVLDVDSAIEDFRRAKEMGMVGMMMPGNPMYEDYDHPDYDALWECATDLDLPVCFHILTAKEGDLASAFAARRGHPLNGFMGIIRAVQDVVGVLTLGGVFERHPKLKMVCAEGDAGWMPHYMYRMDHAAQFNVEGGIIPGLSKLPSEYLKSNVSMTFQDDWVAFKTKDLMNYKQLIWANDYPHTDSTWPHSQELLAEHATGLTPEETRAILRDNTARLFNLDVTAMPMMEAAE